MNIQKQCLCAPVYLFVYTVVMFPPSAFGRYFVHSCWLPIFLISLEYERLNRDIIMENNGTKQPSNACNKYHYHKYLTTY